MSAETRERSPLRVWVRYSPGGWYPWNWYCPQCRDHGAHHRSLATATTYAVDHIADCPGMRTALRLARLEAELEKLADHLDEAAEIASNDGGNGWRSRSSDYRLAALWLTTILNRHRGTDAH